MNELQALADTLARLDPSEGRPLALPQAEGSESPNEILVDAQTAKRALRPLDRMLSFSA